LAGGNRTTDFDRCVVEELDRSRSGNVSGDSHDCGRVAGGITGLDQSVVQDIVIDLQRVACRDFQDAAGIVCNQEAAHGPVSRAGMTPVSMISGCDPLALMIPLFRSARWLSPIVPAPAIASKLVGVAAAPSPTIELLALSVNVTWPPPLNTTSPVIFN
jgi:hypothetical protein